MSSSNESVDPGNPSPCPSPSPRPAFRSPVVLVAIAMFLLSGGENLWRKFLPKYLQALGAPIRAFHWVIVSM